MPAFDDLKLGCIIVIREVISALPLKSTAIRGTISGPLAEVTVEQKFHNPFTTPITLEYLMPLPEGAAISGYQISIGDRTIQSILKERQSARQTYEEAVASGQRASLLEERRPNLFAIEIGNVQPNEAILTTIRYTERLKYSDGRYEFVFPMGITPKYHAASESAQSASGTDAPVEPDASQVGPVTLELSVDAGVPLTALTSPSHEIDGTQDSANTAQVRFAQREIPNRDFTMHYECAAEDLQAAVWLSDEGDTGAIALITALPPRLDLSAEPDPREFIFVIDRSGSMQGAVFVQARNALKACLRALGEQDAFTILAFDDRLEWFAALVQAVSADSVAAADGWIDKLTARGGTEILGALKSALALPTDTSRARYVVFLTDGAVSDEERVLQEVSAARKNARIFTFGIGPSVNRALLGGMARLGRGAAEFLRQDEDIEGALTRFQDRVGFPSLTDLELLTENTQLWDTYPVPLPDLFVGQPLEIATRLQHGAAARIAIAGKRGGQPVTFEVHLPSASAVNTAVRQAWAKARLTALTDDLARGADLEATRAKIISLALEFGLVTQFTSFVAVDSQATGGDAAMQVRVSQPLPQGLEMSGFLGGVAGGGAVQGPPSPRMARPMRARFSLLGHNLYGGRIDEPEPVAGIKRLEPSEPDAISFDEEDPSTATTRPRRDPSLIAGLVAARADQHPMQPAMTTIEERIRWLARTQNMDGSWGRGAEQLEVTAAALLAFVRAGHTLRVGSYRRQLSKAAMWLLANLTRSSGEAHIAAETALSALIAADGLESDPRYQFEVSGRAPSPTLAALLAGDASALANDRSDRAETWRAVGKQA